MSQQKGFAHILILIAAIGLVAFLVITSVASFKNGLFANLFPRIPGFASGPISGPITSPSPTPTPIPSPIVYSLQPLPSDQITMDVSTATTGYGIYALLKQNGQVVIDQTAFAYNWSVNDPTIVSQTPFTGCTNGIQTPCPYDHTDLKGLQPGTTTVRVGVFKSSVIVATQLFTITVTAPSPTPTLMPSPSPIPSPTPCPNDPLSFIGGLLGLTTCPTPIPTPTPVTQKRAFVTSGTYNGNLGGLSGADSKCQDRANAASLGGIWKAWLSDGLTTASSRLTHFNGPYVLATTGTKIANSWTDLTDGTLIAAFQKSELNTTVIRDVWTNTTTNGSILDFNNTCSNWTNSSFSINGRTGISNQTNLTWTTQGTGSTGLNYCTNQRSIYCLEQ